VVRREDHIVRDCRKWGKLQRVINGNQRRIQKNAEKVKTHFEMDEQMPKGGGSVHVNGKGKPVKMESITW